MATWPSNPSLPSLALAKRGYAILVSELVEILMALLAIYRKRLAGLIFPDGKNRY